MARTVAVAWKRHNQADTGIVGGGFVAARGFRGRSREGRENAAECAVVRLDRGR
jgi:hypothetical protein